MAHLTDMEELVSSVQTQIIRDYMSEALSCYMAGAYRATVVLTFIALFDDILAKLGELGKVNKKAKTIFDSATQKRADQEVFETYLIDQLKSNALLTNLDAAFLETLRTLRNKAAHPSGHHASAEEARFVFFEAASRFLSKPILSTTQLADEVLSSLDNANLFPSTNIQVVIQVVKKELANLHAQAYPYLVSKLLEKSHDPDATASKNARFFLSGLARVGEIEAVGALKKYAIEQKASDSSYRREIITLLSANGELFVDLEDVTYKRIAVLVADTIEQADLALDHTKLAHPASVFLSLFAANPSSFVLGKLGSEFNAFLEKFTYSAYFSSKILTIPEPRERLLATLYQRAGSVDFGTANTFAKHADDIEKVMADALSPDEAFRLIVHMIRAAEIGAFAAIDMKNGHFGAVPKLRAKALAFLKEDVNVATSVAAEILGVTGTEVADLLITLEPME